MAVQKVTFKSLGLKLAPFHRHASEQNNCYLFFVKALTNIFFFLDFFLFGISEDTST